MPSSPDTIDDAAFLTELENFDGSLRDGVADSQAQPIRVDVLDKAFGGHDTFASEPYPSFSDLPPFRDPDAESAPVAGEARSAEPHAPRSPHRRIDVPALAVALVFVMGLAAGASAAAIVFYDRAAQIVSAWAGPHR
jgi:hypothetical protein